jgi:E1A-binding protein p400
MWCPPTPPQDDNDVYIDHSMGFLYEQTIMSESQLPVVYVKKEQKRMRMDALPAAEREGTYTYYIHTHAHIICRFRIC